MSAKEARMRGEVRRLLLEHVRPHRRALAVGGVLGFAGTATGLAQPLAAKWVMDSVGARGPVWGPVVVLAGLVVLGAVAAGAGTYLLERTAAGVVRAARGQLVTRIVRLRVDALDRPGDLISRVTSDTTLLSSAATQAVVNSANALVMLIGGIVMMAVLDPILLGISGAVLVLALGAASLVMTRISRAQEGVQRAVGDIGAALERVLGAFRTVKASVAEDRETSKLRAAVDEAWRFETSTAKWNSVARGSAGIAVQLAFLVVLGTGGARVAAGDLGVSSLVAFLLYLFNLSQPISTLVQSATEFQSGVAAVRRMREVQQMPAEAVAAAASTVEPASRPPAGASFRNVSFGYRADPVIHDVSFEIPPGGVTAFVGESGAGKTTLFSLLERFYEPTSGTISIDGRDVADWPLTELRGQIGYVEQDAPVLAGSLRDNICYSAPGATEEELWQALAKTRLTDFVTGLPAGLDTEVGHRGTTLSGGQRQRIAIARALLRRPRILLMDEATSQLDAANELALRETVTEVARTATVIMIAHRLSTVMDADRIIVLERGRVRAQGRHAQLLRGDSLYRELAGAQLLAG
ncbi:ABC transporter ATP-binding protein [Microbispora sp. ZYX-F-249]|uniref:ABC transporter ATP-binding protein n=1 Tax=Microbispora maris TaxID=3144104 RepID=A0ABV0AKX7_9ACTN